VGSPILTWHEAHVRAAIAALVADAEVALDGCVWPVHPLDDDVTASERTTLYLGAAGMIWALRRLGSSLDLDSLATGALEHYRMSLNPDERASLFKGEPGLLLLTRSDGLMDEAQRSAEILVEEWERHDWEIWDVVVGGHEFQAIGPAHGFAGNVHVLRDYVDADVLRARIEHVLRKHAVWDGGEVNWPAGPGHPVDRIQWCHGAPGIVATLGDLMAEDLLLGGAETTWRHGPLDKGPGLCHGTAGNGYALLKTYAVTGDEIWLERARSFALAALDQRQRRYSLMTGDIGAALFAQACIDVDARFPILDVL
jgi:hypothetical protein